MGGRLGRQTRIVEMLGEANRRETIKMLGSDGRKIEVISEMTPIET